MEGASERVRIRLVASGMVQGVGFRRFVERRALRHGLAGWVRNLADGRVEIAAEGPRPTVEQFCADVEQGPPGARVQDIATSRYDDTEPLPRPFRIVRG